MCTKSLSCPLCCQSNFPNIDALRISLLKVTSRPLKCPICSDELLGLDKLTIHLFGHSILGPEDGGKSAPPAPPTAEKKKSSNAAAATNQLKSVRKSRKESTPRNQTQEAQTSIKCDICGDEFRDQSLLQMHTSVFHEFPTSNGGSQQGEDKPENRFQCTVCSKAFKMKGSLKIHMRVVHLGCPKKSTAVSSTCTSISSSSNTTTYMNSTITTAATTVAPVYQSNDVIQHCNVQNTSPPPLALQSLPPTLHQSSLTISTSPHSQPQIIKIIDPRQLAEFIYVANQQQQQQQQQQVIDRAIINSTPPSVPSPKDTICNSIPPSPSQQPSPQAATQAGLATSSDTSNKQWECDVCLKSFTTKYFLKKHKRLHTGEMPYSCQICGKAFTFQQSYHKHLLYHSDEKPHICSVCGRAFKELSTLHNHERIHSGEKPFSCETCGKCFRQRVSYLVHRRIHTNTQPYKCTACDKSFRYKVSQRTHKCPAQPPGTVVRQTGDLLQKLLQSSAILPTLHESPAAAALAIERSPPLVPPSSVETTDDHELQEIKSEDYINRTLDELLNESYDKMGIGSGDAEGNDHHAVASSAFEGHHQLYHQHQQHAPCESTSIVPRIENLCLMSPGSQAFDGETMEVIDSYKLDLLYN